MWQSSSPGSFTLLLSTWGCPFPMKSLALPAHVSPRTLHFQVLDKSLLLGPGRGPPFCNSSTGEIPFFLKGRPFMLQEPLKIHSYIHMLPSPWLIPSVPAVTPLLSSPHKEANSSASDTVLYQRIILNLLSISGSGYF